MEGHYTQNQGAFSIKLTTVEAAGGPIIRLEQGLVQGTPVGGILSAIAIFRQSAEASYSKGGSRVGQNPKETASRNAFDAHPNDV